MSYISNENERIHHDREKKFKGENTTGLQDAYIRLEEEDEKRENARDDVDSKTKTKEKMHG